EEGRNRRLYVSPRQPPLGIDFQLPKNTPADLIGQKVAVRFLSWGLKYPVGEIVQVLGAPRQHQTEIHAIVLEFGLSETFSPEALAEAEALPAYIPPEEEAQRHDFREVPTFTIDPQDAKDFDDALSFRTLPSGLYEVGVHIADVSYYVRPGSALDREAYARGTSVYLVDRTLPMLPPRLSADLCSLRPEEDRLAFSVVMQMDAQARVHSLWMGRSIIRSQRRFTYEEAQAVLESGQGPWAETLRTLNELAKKLHASRMKEGGIRFETEEIRFVLDEQQRPLRLYLKQRKDAHKLIEEFMLLANRQVAQFLAQQKGLPVIYRVHDLPKPDKLKALQLFLEGFGYQLDTRNARSLTRSLNELIARIEGQPEAHIIQAVAIRSLPKALYTPHNIGHYGLGFTHYTHFTSPIRRYPDLLTHRILAAVLEGSPSSYSNTSLEEACRHCSAQEKRAEQAERASIRYKQLEYLAQMEGKLLEGLIVGIETWGLYIELTESRAEGLVSIRTLPSDVYERDEYGHVLRGRYTRRQYRLGDPVLVRVEGIDFDRRLVDLSLIQHQGEPIT
ncbi:MAG: ribonuclease R, partial [Bacteroidetes bacterium]